MVAATIVIFIEAKLVGVLELVELSKLVVIMVLKLSHFIKSTMVV